MRPIYKVLSGILLCGSTYCSVGLFASEAASQPAPAPATQNTEQNVAHIITQVTQNNGQQLRGLVCTMSPQALLLDDQQFNLADISNIEHVQASTEIAAPGITQYAPATGDWQAYANGILLQDGSWIPVGTAEAVDAVSAATIGADKIDDSIRVVSPFGVLHIPLEYVAAWGDYEQISAASTSDYVLLGNGNNAYGELLGIHGGDLQLQTELSDKPLVIPLSSVRGVRLRAQPQPIQGIYLLAYTNPQRPPMKLRSGTQPHLALIEKIELNDWAKLARLEVIGGAVTSLDTRVPSSIEEKGLFGKVWHYSRDTNIDGSPLYLGGRRYAHGLVLHSYTNISWEIPVASKGFRCLLGISDQMGQEGNCSVQIFADEKLCWSNDSVRGGEAAVAINLQLNTAKSLRIKVDYGERYDIADHLVIANPFLY